MTTHWSVYRDLSLERRELEPERAQQALAQLCEDYWTPLYWFVRRRGYRRDDAHDLTQGFFAYLLEKNAYATHDPTKGRFRGFLLALLKRYLGAAQATQSRVKRGGDRTIISLDAGRIDYSEAAAERALLTAAPQDEERAFDCRWAAEIVARAMQALTAEYAEGKRARVLAELRPFLTGGVGLPTHEEVARRLQVPEDTLRSYLFRLRSRYRVLLQAEVARTVLSDEDVESELRYLCRVLVTSA